MKICNAVTSDVKEIYNLIEILRKRGSGFTAFFYLYQYLQCLYVMKEEGKSSSCWFTCIRRGPCRSPIVSRFCIHMQEKGLDVC